MRLNRDKKAFTLIELLIVVAIIAILAAIAVPNFLEAQVRAKVSKVKADIRSAATCLEAYRTDYNNYPYDGYNYPAGSDTTVNDGDGNHPYTYWYLPADLTTPVAFCTTVGYNDPFREAINATASYGDDRFNDVRYICSESTWGEAYDMIQSPANNGTSGFYDEVLQEWGGWRINSAGPDKTYGPTGWTGVSTYPACPLPYNPTNGTVSDGDIQRSQMSPSGYVNAQ